MYMHGYSLWMHVSVHIHVEGNDWCGVIFLIIFHFIIRTVPHNWTLNSTIQPLSLLNLLQEFCLSPKLWGYRGCTPCRRPPPPQHSGECWKSTLRLSCLQGKCFIQWVIFLIFQCISKIVLYTNCFMCVHVGMYIFTEAQLDSYQRLLQKIFLLD